MRAPAGSDRKKKKKGGGRCWAAGWTLGCEVKRKGFGLLERCGLEEGRKVEVGRAVSWAAR
jgi:hypothetical protein